MSNKKIHRAEFDRIVDEYRAAQRELMRQPIQRAQREVADLGVAENDYGTVLSEVQRRAAMSDEVSAVRRMLDAVADRARGDEEYRLRLLASPGETLAAEGIDSADVDQIVSEMDVSRLEQLHIQMRCQFTCCKHPATDWSCNPSVLV